MPHRIGVLGGTFDPIHHGHLMIAEVISDYLRLDDVLFAPAGTPPHKPRGPITSAAHRLRMTELAIADNSRFIASSIDLVSGGHSFTVDLIGRVALFHPGSELFFLMGADSLRDFLSWHEPAEIVRRAQLAVAHRPGVALESERLFATLPELRSRTTLVPSPGLDLSATQIRSRVVAGQSIRYLVPESVREYILSENLYSEYGE